MRLLVNLASIHKGGAEQVALSFLHELRAFPQHVYCVVYRSNLFDQVNEKDFPNNFEFHHFQERPGGSFIRLRKSIKKYKKIQIQFKPDCVIATGGHGYFLPKDIPVVGGFNIPHFIYGESPYFQNMSFKKRMYWKFMAKFHFSFYNRLDAIFVQTIDVKKRLQRIVGQKKAIYVISNTVNANYINPQRFPNKLPKKLPNEIRLLTLASYYPHKNIEIIKKLIQNTKLDNAYEIRFVVSLSKDKYEEIFSIEEQKFVYNVGRVPVVECPSLYQEIDFMFLPTLLECYSASYAEAMYMEKPIITSDLSFARTVCKDAAIYFSPMDPIDITNKIFLLADDEYLQRELISKGKEIIKNTPSATDRASEFLNICMNAVNQR